MNLPKSFGRRSLWLSVVCIIVLASVIRGQDRAPKRGAEQNDEVVRINTELVQTDITVTDKQGRFVDGLQPSQFELRVDGKVQSISFFERVAAEAGSDQANTPQSSSATTSVESLTPTGTPPRGRTIFFFIDDLHLAADSLMRAREALFRFVENEMRQNDWVAIISASGQVGFLQQLTDNKAVLREAIGRLNYRRNPVTDFGIVTISEYDANQVEGRNRELFNYLVQSMARLGSTAAAQTVINRTREISATARFDTMDMLSGLEGLLLSSAPLPGRKVVFFVSDGFVTDPRRTGTMERMRGVARTAARVGAVIYTMDARGTFADPSTDASRNAYPDFTGSVSRNIFAEASATQEPLRILADDTGGRAILNSNSFDDGFRRALGESSSYYLLAWRPEREEQRDARVRVVVQIKGRPDLKVRVRRGLIEPPSVSSAKNSAGTTSSEANSPDAALLATLGSLYPVRELPVSLSVGYMSVTGGGMVLAATMQLEAGAPNSEAQAETQKAEFDVLGVAMDDRGRISSFKQRLTVPPEFLYGTKRQPVVWNQQLPLPPGLYQVRVAVRDRRSGRTGSAMQWLEIPSLAQSFSMSSIFVGERRAEVEATPQKVSVNASRRFARGSLLRFQTYIYNARRVTGSTPDVLLRVEVLRDDRPVLKPTESKLATAVATDPTRIPYSGEIPLGQLTTGRYLLRISATDQATKTSISQSASFVVE